MRPLLVALLLLCSPAWAQDPQPVPPAPPAPVPVVAPFVKLPAELTVDVGDLIVIPIKTNVDRAKLKQRIKSTVEKPYQAYPAGFLNPEFEKSNWAAQAKKAAVVTFEMWGGDERGPTDIAECVITIGTPVPPIPPAPPVPAPTAEMQTLVAPIKAIVAAQPDATKRARVAAMWGDFLAVIQARPLTTVGALNGAMTDFLSAAVQTAGLGGSFPGYDAALNAAFRSRFGAEDGALDAARAQEFVSALVWAAK